MLRAGKQGEILKVTKLPTVYPSSIKDISFQTPIIKAPTYLCPGGANPIVNS